MVSALLVALGAAVGAPLRYLGVLAVDRRLRARAPWGLHAVNTAGSLVLGVVVGAAVPASWLALVGTGFCGALTTFSAFAFDHVLLAERGQRLLALVSTLVGVVAGLVAALVGLGVGASVLSVSP